MGLPYYLMRGRVPKQVPQKVGWLDGRRSVAKASLRFTHFSNNGCIVQKVVPMNQQIT